MRLFKSPLFWGVALVVVGGLLLLQAFGVLLSGLIWPLVFAVAGVGFLYFFLRDRDDNWWAAIPAFILVGLAAVITWGELVGTAAEETGAVMLFAISSLGFIAVYLARHEHWWAVIPGGALLSLALLVSLTGVAAGQFSSGMFLVGLAVTFGVLAALPTPEGRMRWPLIPAAILALVGVLVAAEAAAILNYVWPVVLILAGLYLIFRAYNSYSSGGRPGRHA